METKTGLEFGTCTSAAKNSALSCASAAGVDAADTDPGVDMPIGDRIRQLRKERKWSQGDLATEVGGDAGQISRYENGHIAPSADAIVRLAEALDVSCDYLLVDDAPRRPFRSAENLLGDHLAGIDELDDTDLTALRHILDALIANHRIKTHSPPAPADRQETISSTFKRTIVVVWSSLWAHRAVDEELCRRRRDRRSSSETALRPGHPNRHAVQSVKAEPNMPLAGRLDPITEPLAPKRGAGHIDHHRRTAVIGDQDR